MAETSLIVSKGLGGCVTRKRIVFFGRVQGVGFRYHARYAASFYGCTGWARNEDDGSVTMEIQGTEEQIDKVILAIQRQKFIRVDGMDVQILPFNESERGFRTVYTSE